MISIQHDENVDVADVSFKTIGSDEKIWWKPEDGQLKCS